SLSRRSSAASSAACTSARVWETATLSCSSGFGTARATIGNLLSPSPRERVQMTCHSNRREFPRVFLSEILTLLSPHRQPDDGKALSFRAPDGGTKREKRLGMKRYARRIGLLIAVVIAIAVAVRYRDAVSSAAALVLHASWAIFPAFALFLTWNHVAT